jgi:D-arabinose 1-dehydrogenase-like Zn-dependent alcohol dehydrogenase
MSNFNHIPDDVVSLDSHVINPVLERVCQTCAHCTWDNGTKCRQPLVLGLEHDTALEHGLSISTAYRLCKGEHWQEQEWEE